jgi:hypothetical protein
MAARPHGVELRSDALTVRVEPRLGGRITSLETAGGVELLARGGAPSDPVGPADDYLAGGLGGFDDCLPGIAPEVLQEPDRVVPDHGEVWCRPATVTESSGQRLVLRQTGIGERHVFQRTLALDGGRLRIDYVLENLRDGPYEALWAAHPLLPLTADCRLELDGLEEVTVYASTFARRGETLALGDVAVGGDRSDLTRPATLPAGHTLKAFAPLPPSTHVGVAYPAHDTRLLLCLHAHRRAWLGLWLNAGGFPARAPVRHLALEPSFGAGDRLSETIADGSCLRVPPRGRASWTLELEVGPLGEPARRARPDGRSVIGVTSAGAPDRAGSPIDHLA